MKTVNEFIEFAEQAYKDKWGYVWGADGEIYNGQSALKLYQTFGSEKSKYNKEYYLVKQLNRYNGKRVSDCSGLITAFRGIDDTASGLYLHCTNRGEFANSRPTELKGWLVFCMSSGVINHVGIVVQDDNNGCKVIHNHGSDYGILKENLIGGKRKWTHYGKPEFFINFSENVSRETFPTLRKGDKNEYVMKLQKILNTKFSAGLEIDGSFGSKTENAVKQFQKNCFLIADGIVGRLTWEMLNK